MDNKRFDDIARKLASTASRRGTLKGLLGAGVASVVALAKGHDAGAQDVSEAVCIPNGRTCGVRKRPGCNKCCSKNFRPGVGNKANRCACRPEGAIANPNRPEQCCSGFVVRGRCADFGS